jgi:hypothetical protein
MPVALIKWLEGVSIFLIAVATILLVIYELLAVFFGAPTISDQVREFTQKYKAISIAIALELLALQVFLLLHFLNVI